MKKTFLLLLAVLLALNLVYKTVGYLMANKITGTVTGYIEHSSKTYGPKGYKTLIIAPLIRYEVEGKKYETSFRKWGGLFKPDVGHTVTLLYNDNVESPELNRFFQYWLGIKEVLIIFGLSGLLNVIIYTIKDKRKKPEA